MQSRAAIRYAKAIYEIADEENFVKEIFNDMMRINKLNRDSSDFKNLLSNSIIDNFDKKKAILSLLEIISVTSAFFIFQRVKLEKFVFQMRGKPVECPTVAFR